MIDVKELERRWIRYKIKQYLPYSLLVLSLGIAIVFIYLLFGEQKNSIVQQTKQQKSLYTTAPKEIQQEANKSKEVTKPVEKKEKEQTKVVVVEEKNSTIPPKTQEQQVLRPSLNFLSSMKQRAVLPTQQEQENEPTPNVTLQSTTNTQTTKKKKEPKKEQKLVITKKSSNKVKIEVKKTSKKEIEEVIKRFKKSNNPILSLFIARKYYELGEYHKSYNYALLTNQIDPTIEDSWIIFAKSLVKLGQKKRAIEALQAYIKVSKSNNAKILLNKIISGKFQ